MMLVEATTLSAPPSRAGASGSVAGVENGGNCVAFVGVDWAKADPIREISSARATTSVEASRERAPGRLRRSDIEGACSTLRRSARAQDGALRLRQRARTVL